MKREFFTKLLLSFLFLSATAFCTIQSANAQLNPQYKKATLKKKPKLQLGFSIARYFYNPNNPSSILPITGPNTVCAGDTIQLNNSTPGGTWQLSDPSIATIDATTGQVATQTDGADTALYIVTTGSKSDTAAFSFTINPLPFFLNGIVPVSNKNSYTICQYLLDTFVCISTPNIGVGFWSSSDTSIAIIDSVKGILYGKQAGQIYLNYKFTFPTGCHASPNSQNIVIFPKPQLDSIGGYDTACKGAGLQFTDSIFGGTWWNSNSSIGSVNPFTGTYSANKVGSDTVYYAFTNSVGCSDTVSKSLYVKSTGCDFCPTNIGFELGKFTSWVCKNGSVGPTNNSTYKFPITGPTVSLHTITSNSSLPRRDPYGNFPVFYGKTGGKYSAKINDETTGSKAVRISYTFLIPPGQQKYQLVYYYAAVLEDGTHANWEQPGFHKETKDLGPSNQPYAQEKYVACDSGTFTPNVPLPNWKLSSVLHNGNSVHYCAWTPVSIILKNLGGHLVKLEFTSFDCIFGGHFGYAYVDIDSTCSVNVVPTSLISGSDFCTNQSSINLTAPYGYQSYVWYDTAFHKPPLVTKKGINTLTISPVPQKDSLMKLVEIPYDAFKGPTATGCYDTIDVHLVAHNPPKMSPIVGKNEVCAGSSIVLQDSTLADTLLGIGGVWTPYNLPIISVSKVGVNASLVDTALITGLQQGIDSIKYVVTTMYGCKDSTKFTITVDSVPTVQNITGITSICTGLTTTLSNPTVGGKWSSSDTSKAKIDSLTGFVTTLKSGLVTFKYTVTNSFGCSVYASWQININSVPLPPITGSNVVCMGLTNPLANVATGGTWYSSNASIATIDQNGVVTGVSGGLDTIKYVAINSTGCLDSSYLYISVSSSTSSINPISICPSDFPFSWNNQTYTIPGTYVVHLTNALGCDSAATIILSAKAVASTNFPASICKNALPYSWHGKNYSLAGSYPDTLAKGAVNGCDSITTLVLTIKDTTISTTSKSICPSELPYTWNNKTFSAAGTYPVTLSGANSAGCDSIATLILTLKPTSQSSTTINVCPKDLPYKWNNNTYSSAGTYVVHLSNSVGCDSAATLILNVKAVSNSSTPKSICRSDLPYSWNGQTYQSAGTYVVTLTNSVGCDSVAKLVLTVNEPTTSSITKIACDSFTWSSNNTTYYTSGSYSILHPHANSTGCDSVEQLSLTIITVNVSLDAKPNPVFVGAPVTINANVSTNGSLSSWQWLPSNLFTNQNQSSQTYTADTTRWIYAKATVGNCVGEDSVKVVVKPISEVFVPNAFVPNGTGDKRNQKLSIFSNLILKNVEFFVFNQWGQLVFKSYDQNYGWDGTYGGSQQPVGVYIYTLKATLPNGKQINKKGSVTLVR